MKVKAYIRLLSDRTVEAVLRRERRGSFQPR